MAIVPRQQLSLFGLSMCVGAFGCARRCLQGDLQLMLVLGLSQVLKFLGFPMFSNPMGPTGLLFPFRLFWPSGFGSFLFSRQMCNAPNYVKLLCSWTNRSPCPQALMNRSPQTSACQEQEDTSTVDTQSLAKLTIGSSVPHGRHHQGIWC